MRYEFKNKGLSKKFLVCPNCGEELTYADIEIYPACPYCDCAFERTCELEDFILQPLVKQWELQCNISAHNGIFINGRSI